MIKNTLLTLLWIIYSTTPLLSENTTERWSYKKWETTLDSEGTVKFTTHGSAVYGHEFGFIKRKKQCDENLLWITWSTYNKGIDKYIDKEVQFELKIDNKTIKLNLDVLTVYEFSSVMKIVIFSNFQANDNFINTLKKGSTLSVSVKGPSGIIKLFDMPNEEYSLSGFTANYEKAKATCLDPKAILLPPVVKKANLKRIVCTYVEEEIIISGISGRSSDTSFTFDGRQLYVKGYGEPDIYEYLSTKTIVDKEIKTYISKNNAIIQTYDDLKLGAVGFTNGSYMTYEKCSMIK